VKVKSSESLETSCLCRLMILVVAVKEHVFWGLIELRVCMLAFIGRELLAQ